MLPHQGASAKRRMAVAAVFEASLVAASPTLVQRPPDLDQLRQQALVQVSAARQKQGLTVRKLDDALPVLGKRH
ncbi:hypothetical protein OO17_05465 [Rhodopseudomonas palustris]|uniref:Uncharacterized protein n=1 Tax=Rhodopseudomonas palustris TaxID=1076 RepID=A0A0D7F2Z4_RHOPL|nr:hypothetical protein OO17_05465 [Rhodopseudomonas palustris]